MCPDQKVFDWLGSDDRGIPYYLKTLNLRSGQGEQKQAVLKRFEEVANHLQKEPLYWSEILRTGNWRYTLIGCICVLMTHDDGHFQDLGFSFEQGNWVAPQIAVTMGIVYPKLACEFFDNYLGANAPKKDVTGLVSAQLVLSKIHSTVYTPCEWDSSKDKYAASIAISVVENYWDFWFNRRLGSTGIV